uniref:Pentatricopeptide repeat-containing protein n=1 Tax=Talaromyces marneffei PM1 TaxID=1077442 RepID=A0A093V8C8_TALMA
MLAFGGRGRQFRVPLVAAQRLSNAGCVSTCFDRNPNKFTVHSTKFGQATLPINNTLVKSFSTTFSNYQTLQSSDVAQPTKPSHEKRTAEVYRVLRNGDPRQIFLTLGNPVNSNVVELLPDSVFVSALLRLTPENLLEPFVDILAPIHGALLSTKKINPPAYILNQFFHTLNHILTVRTRGGKELGLVEYRHLLRIPASIGGLKTAIGLWRKMKKSGIEPDVQCYNLFMQACVWERAVYGPARNRVRVTPYYYRRRRFGVGIKGYGTASRSVRKEVNSICTEMRKIGLVLNEDTYINQLLASARVGGRLDMDRILKDVWMIDVEAIMTKPPDQLPAARPLVESSPIYPTQKLLFAVAHAYGCNSRLKEALLITDYISQQYGIEITDDIWAELVERGYVLSRRRVGRYAQANLWGKMDSDLLFELKKMLRLDGQPYDMFIYSMLANSTCRHRQYHRFQDVVREAYQLLRKTRRERNHALRVLETTLNIPLQVDAVSHPIEGSGLGENCKTPRVWRALQKYERLRLLVEQQQIFMEKVIGSAVKLKRWTDPWDFEWTHRLFPRFLAEWKDFLPESYSIILPTGAGKIEFYGRTNFSDANLRTHNNEPVRWSDCGEFVAEEDEQIQPRHEALWAHVKDRLGELVHLQPLQWFFSNGWSQDPVYFQQLREPRVSEIEGDPSLDDVAEESVQKHLAEQPEEVDREHPQHCFYVTMIPLYDIAL